MNVVFQHLFPLRLRPVGRRAVAEEPAVHIVEHRRVGHGVQRLAKHGGVEVLAGGALKVEDKAKDAGISELRLPAQTAVAGIVCSGHDAGYPVNQRILDLGPGCHAAGVYAPLLQQVAGLFVEAGLVGLVRSFQFHQHRQKLVGWQVGGAAYQSSVGRQESGRGPAAHVVAGVDVGAVVVVHPDGDKAARQDGLNIGVGVGGLVHHMAPVAPGGGDGQQYGLVFGLRSLKGGTRPRQPFDAVRLVGVGRETNAGHYACPEPAGGRLWFLRRAT